VLKRRNFENIFWFLWGAIIFIPFEILSEGLYFAYLQGAFLMWYSKVPNIKNLVIFFAYCACVCISILLSADPTIASIVNPILIALLLLMNEIEERILRCLKLGILCSACVVSLYLIYLLYQKGLNTFAALMIDREWAIDKIFFFGNGLAVLLVLGMMFAFKTDMYSIFVLLFVGAALTTSRIPFLASILIIPGYFLKAGGVRKAIIVSISILVVAFFSGDSIYEYFSDVSSLAERVTFADDRIDVYKNVFDSIYDHPFFGVGSNKLNFYEHAHNSYLQILYKYGFFSLILFIDLVWYGVISGLLSNREYAIILVIFVCTATQVALLSPNFLIVLKILFSKYYQSNKASD